MSVRRLVSTGKKVAHTRLPSVGFRSWSRYLSVSLQVTSVINPAVGCHYFSPGLQLPPQPLRGLLPILLLGEQRHSGCEQFAWDCYPTASRLRFEPGLFCAWVQHTNHSATEPSSAHWYQRKVLDFASSIKTRLTLNQDVPIASTQHNPRQFPWSPLMRLWKILRLVLDL